MLASKDFNTGNKIILREIRLEKGGSRLNLNEKKGEKTNLQNRLNLQYIDTI